MNKNIEDYKKAVDQIHVDQDLKEKVLKEAESKQKNKNLIYYFRYLTAVAAIALVAVVGICFLTKPKEEVLNPNKNIPKQEETEKLANVDIKRFESVEELREVLKNSRSTATYYEGMKGVNTVDDIAQAETIGAERDTSSTPTANSDYSRTNNQVENVDEADIVKTDGKYIYYSQNERIYIVDTDLNLKATIKEDKFYPLQIFVNGNKLVVFGREEDNRLYHIPDAYLEETDDVMREEVISIYKPKTYIRVYNLSDIENPKLVREVNVDGNYQDARMIENNVYMVTNYYPYFYYELDTLKDKDILPCYEDSVSNGVKYINATDIAYFRETENYSYSLIVGFNLNSDDLVNIETFFGAGSEMYVSENNLYLIASKGYWNAKESTIYKFKLEDAKVLAVASGNVKGFVRNQFSMDEYEGNLRIATTSWESNSREFWYDDYYEEHYSTHLTIFNENLEKIGEIENLIKDEEIYSVRFIGKVGYIVTFQEIDPLWIIDLSDPTNPVVKGELEIPGYSSYLHPYDETHIIGIGYNVRDNGHGGVTNDTLKISMFDVSDVRNPKEIFNKTFENKNAYSNISYEHKALFFNKSENLIGFPVSWWTRRENKSGLVLYRIDMENKKFEEIDDLIEASTYSSIERAVYIGNNIYTMHMDRIIKYDLKTFEKIKTLELEYDNERYYYYY